MNQHQYFMSTQNSSENDEDDYRFVFTVNTQATTSGNTISAIPFDLYTSGQQNGNTVTKQSGVTLTVDWGDGTTQTLSNSDYTSTDATASIHTYSEAGTYIIKVDCNNWSNCYFCSSGGTDASTQSDGYNDITPANSSLRNRHLAYWKETLISIDSSIKNIPGILEYAVEQPTESDVEFIDNSAHCMFYNCKKLSSITPKLFKNLTYFTHFYSTFEHANSLVTIPTGLFSYNTAVTNFNRCFYGMKNLEIVPSTLFQKCVNVIDFTYLFATSPKLVRIPKGIFDYNVNAEIFTDIFQKCTALTEIPENMFLYNTKATIFQSAFRKTNIEYIPDGLFGGCVSVTSYQQCFAECSKLKEIPKDLFINCGSVINMKQCFNQCTSLTSLDEDVFKGLVNVSSFEGTLRGCTRITSIPQNLFRYNTKADNFNTTFSDFRVTTIPDGLFDNCVNATKFQNTFQNCSLLTSIPIDLFKYNINAYTFTNCFYQCTSLNDFSVRIGSKKVSSCAGFVTLKENTTRIVYVPSGSTTQTKFNNVADGLGLTIIGE